MNLVRSLVSSAQRPVRVERTGTMYEIRVDGQSIFAPWIHRWRYYREGFEKRLDTVCARYGLGDLHPYGEGEWVIDVGAYMGELTIRMLRNGFNVLSFEPDPEAARCLRKNLECHGPGSKEWIVDTRVCSDRYGQVTFHSEPHGADSSIFPSVARPSRAVRLDGARLDDIVEERLGERPVRGLKVDAEGAEPEVLAGAPRLLERIPVVSVDAGYERRGEPTFEECRRILRESGYSLLSDERLAREIVVGNRRAPADSAAPPLTRDSVSRHDGPAGA